MTPVTEAVPVLKLTERINRIEPSATMAVVAMAMPVARPAIAAIAICSVARSILRGRPPSLPRQRSRPQSLRRR